MSESLQVDDLLLAHAAGSLPLPVGLAVATHLALSPSSRRLYERYEAVGGHLIETMPVAGMADDAWEQLLGRLDDEDAGEAAPPRPRCGELEGSTLPLPLREFVPGALDELPWRHLVGASTYEIETGTSEFQTSLIRVRAGRAVPQHTHGGTELTVVLEGAFSDHSGRYGRGDLALADGSVDHQPIADADADCLCLTVTDGPVRLTGPLGRLLNPFLRG